MTDSKKTLPFILIISDSKFFKEDEERIEEVYNRTIENIDIIKKKHKNFELFEKKDIYISKYNATKEEMERMYSYKCVIFNVPNLKDAPDFEKNNIKEIYHKESDSSVQMIVVYTADYDISKSKNFCNFIFKKE